MKQLSFFHLPATHCERCGRLLTNTTSIQARRGPVCRGHGKKGDKDMDNEFTDFTLFDPIEQGIILRRDDNDRVYTNIPHLVVYHSPTGYEFGYGGSGPADLALNICEIMLNRLGWIGERTPCFNGDCFTLAWQLHQAFKCAFIEGADREGEVIPYKHVVKWFNERMQE